MPRNEKKTRARGWILKNTRIGPVLDIKVCHHEDQYTDEVLAKSLFQDRTASWVRNVNGVESSTKRYAWLRECHELYSNRTRNLVNKICEAKTQDRLGTHQAIRRLTGKLAATSWITEFLEYLFLQSSSRIQYARTRSRSWSRSLENHKNQKSFLQDLKQTEKINKFSKESQDLIADMNNTEIFELCENSSKQQCLDCNACWEVNIIYCSCGRCLKSTRCPAGFD